MEQATAYKKLQGCLKDIFAFSISKVYDKQDAEDGAKTHNKVYVSGMNLSPDIARDQMVMTKLHGFKALYYHYLYLFGKIRKKETPQRVSFYMREELIKFDRYQKQFHFLIDNDIETTGQLNDMKQNTENKIAELTLKRTRLYSKLDSEDEISDINTELKELRSKLRICNNILEDAKRIQMNYNKALELEEEAERQNRYRNKNQIMR